MARLWPIIIVSVSVGFIFMYILGRREKGLLIAALILLGVGTVAFLLFNYIDFIFPIIFIAGGLILIFISMGAGKKEQKKQAEPDPDTAEPQQEEK